MKIEIHTNDAVEKIYSVSSLAEAELIRGLLEDHKIPCRLDGIHQAGFAGTLAIGILVRERDVPAANEVMQAHHVDD